MTSQLILLSLFSNLKKMQSRRTLFEKVTLCNGRIIAPNRTMRSATWEHMGGPNGEVTPELAEKMVELARHHVGIVCFSYSFVSESGRANPGQLGIESTDVAESYRKAISDICALGSVPMIQLVHGGCRSITGDPVGPSTNNDSINGTHLPQCREATYEDIDRIVKEFVAAAVRAKNVGFEIVMVHSAHGYLLSQFLSPMFNRRTDKYGGSLENRARLLLTIISEIKKALGDDFPVSVKLNTEDTFPTPLPSLSVEESAQVARWLAEAGVCMVEASGGSFGACFSGSRAGKDSVEGYHKEGARLWKKAIAEAGLEGKTLVALVGGIRSRKTAEEFLNDGTCDIISVSRPLIREPDLVDKWNENLDYHAKCVSCNKCFTMEKFECIFNKKKNKQGKCRSEN